MALFWLALFAIGLGAGTLGALLGLGGGIVLVPALTLLFDLPVRTAVGVSLIGVIATSAGVASVSKPGRGADISLALRLETASATGALLGGLASAAGPVRADRDADRRRRRRLLAGGLQRPAAVGAQGHDV